MTSSLIPQTFTIQFSTDFFLLGSKETENFRKVIIPYGIYVYLEIVLPLGSKILSQATIKGLGKKKKFM